MDTLSKHELGTLLPAQGGVCISLFAPTHPSGLETRQDPIRFRNLLRDTETQLLARRLRFPDVKQLLERAYALLDDSYFWRHQSNGLALFLAPDLWRCYHLPIDFEERVIIAPHFHIRPLLPLVGGDERFYVLALSQQAVKVYEGTRYGLHEIELRNAPTSVADALQYDSFERHLSYRSAGPAPAGAGRAAAVFYGSDGEHDPKEQIASYFRQVDEGLRHLLQGSYAPVVLAGVDYVLPIYRGVSKLPHLASEAITGNPDDLNGIELRHQAWSVLQPYFQKKQEEAALQYRQLAGTPRASNKLKAVVQAAHHQRVAALFAAVGPAQWGQFDPETGAARLRRAKVRPGDEDLVNVAAVYTLLNGGVVYAVEPAHMPCDAPLAALFRY